MQFVFKKLTGAGVALALCASPTMAAAATSTPVAPLNPLVAVSVFGTQASAQTVCTSAANTAAAAGAAAAAQGQTGCVLPAVDTAPPPPPAAGPPPPQVSGFGISPVILGLLGIAALAALIASGGDGDDNETPVSPS